MISKYLRLPAALFIVLLAGVISFGQDKPKIALIFDDFGLHSPGHPLMQDFASLACPFAAAIIPGLDYSTQLAELFNEFCKEVIIHMPMESQNAGEPIEPLTLTVDMGIEDIRGYLFQAIFDIPNAVGLSNHQGSLFTSDENAVIRFVTVLSDTSLYFFDSVTVPRSRAYRSALEAGVVSAKRDVFLDVDLEEGEDIETRFADLVRIAGKRGYALGIGHRCRKTFKALTGFLASEMAEEVEIVFPSEIAELNSRRYEPGDKGN